MAGDLHGKNKSEVAKKKIQGNDKLVAHHLRKFRECQERTEIGQAFSHLSMVLTLEPSLQKLYLTNYLQLLELWVSSLEEIHDISKLITLFEVAFNIYPNSSDLQHLLSKLLYKEGNIREAWKYAQQAYSGSKKDPHCKENFVRLTNALIDRWHIPMLNDSTRNKAFKEAIGRAIQEGYGNVLDIGSGTGLLSIYSANSGAKSVIACEIDDYMCDMAKNIIEVNKLTERITVIDKHSTDLNLSEDLPERVSLVVSETVDAGLLGESILQTLSHAWKSLLLPPPPQKKHIQSTVENAESTINLSSSIKENNKLSYQEHKSTYGKVIPLGSDIFVALVECDYIAKQTKVQTQEGNILERFNVCLKFEEPYTCEKLRRLPGGYKLLTEWKCIDNINFNDPEDIENHLESKIEKFFSLECKVQGRIDAIVMAFRLHIDDSCFIETFPESSTCWENSVYPIFSHRFSLVGENINIKYNCSSLINLEIEEKVDCNDMKDSSIYLNSYSVKCLNSCSFTKFFDEAASMIANYFKKLQKKDNLIILDTTPFPIGGLALLKLCPSAELYIDVDDIDIQKALTRAEVQYKTSSSLRSEVDVMFIWPVMEDGTLIDCLSDKCEEIVSRMSNDGILFPSSLNLEVTAIDCEELSQMTKVFDNNTHGVLLADLINVAKTTHQLDLPLSGLSSNCYQVPDSLVNFNLFTGGASTTVQSVCHKIKDNNIDGFMVLGGPIVEVCLPLLPSVNMNINALAYNFSLSGGNKFEKNQSGENSVYSSISNDILPSTSTCEDVSNTISDSRLVESTQTISNSLDLSSLTMSTYDSDSPCNQSVFMLESPVTVKACKEKTNIKEVDSNTENIEVDKGSSVKSKSDVVHLSVVWRDCFFSVSLHHIEK
ncbi:unnamed protein product, partial [Meganyctiphanes norvegica]